MNRSPSGLRDHVGYWLRRLSDEVHLSFERKLADQGVTVAQWNVLVTIYRAEAETVGDIAKFIEVDVAAVSRVVDRLSEKRLVERTVDPGSRRRMPLKLTTAGRKLVPTLIAIADENDDAYFGALSTERRGELVTLSRSLMKNNLRENAS